MNFKSKLELTIKKNDSLLCIGLDPDLEKIPQHIKQLKHPLFAFNKEVIDATHDLVCCYKPNSAFYEAHGAIGIDQLKKTCDYIKEKYQLPILLDAKRADIDNTNKGYIDYAFSYLNTDAITLHPYLGSQALLPFLQSKDKGIFILCRTSNPGAGEFQDLVLRNEPLYKIVAKNVIENWNINDNCFPVVGATYPEELKEVRAVVGEVFILIPGIGTQGGDLQKTLIAGLTKNKSGLIISSSRAILYVSKNKDFAKKARNEAQKLKKEINKHRK